MSITTIALDSSWRDYSGQWNPSAEVFCAALQNSQCHDPRWVVVPSLDEQIIPASGKITFNFHIPPGSILWGLLIRGGFTAQLTDVGLGHSLFQEPITLGVAGTTGQLQGNLESVFVLPCPWPITGEGLFTFEAWGDPGSRVAIYIGCAEAVQCKA